jgi:hypothetical protein
VTTPGASSGEPINPIIASGATSMQGLQRYDNLVGIASSVERRAQLLKIV